MLYPYRSPLALLTVTLALIALLLGIMLWRTSDSPERPLLLYCAASMREPVEMVVEDYRVEFGRSVHVNFGPSETILTQLEVSGEGDLFLPADDSYIAMARDKKLIEPNSSIPIGDMKAVVLLRQGLQPPVTNWEELTRESIKIGQASEAAAIRRVTRLTLESTDLLPTLDVHSVTTGAGVGDVANAVKAGAVDAGIVWDGLARGSGFRHLSLLQLPELANVKAHIEIAIVKQRNGPDRSAEALHFAHYLTAPDKGLIRFREAGFSVQNKISDTRKGEP